MVPGVLQLRPDPFGQLVQMLVDRIERAVLGQKLHRPFRTDAVDARHVVAGVAHDAEIVADLVGADPEFRFHFLFAEKAVVRRVGLGRAQGAHMPVDQLQEVLVAGEDHDVHPLALGLVGKRGDDVVGFEARLVQVPHPHLVQKRADDGYLGVQVLRGLLPVLLVAGKQFMAERWAMAVHGDDQIVGLVLPHQLAQGFEETEDGGDVVPLPVPERTLHHGEVRAVYLRVPVDDEQAFGSSKFRHQAPRSSIRRRTETMTSVDNVAH